MLPGKRPVFIIVRNQDSFDRRDFFLDTSKLRTSIVYHTVDYRRGTTTSPKVEITNLSCNLLSENLSVIGILFTDDYLNEVKPSIKLSYSKLVDFDEVSPGIYTIMNADGHAFEVKCPNEKMAKAILDDLERIRKFIVE